MEIDQRPRVISTTVHVHTCACSIIHVRIEIHVASMLAIGIDKHTQQTNKQPYWLRK